VPPIRASGGAETTLGYKLDFSVIWNAFASLLRGCEELAPSTQRTAVGSIVATTPYRRECPLLHFDRPKPPVSFRPKAGVQNTAFDGRLAPILDARDRCSPIVFSNGSMGDSSVLSGCQRGRVACVLYVLERHLMGSAGCGAAWLKSQSVDDRMLHNRRRHPFPPSGVAPARELGSASCPIDAATTLA
jgi:hypothetical protein